MLSCEEEEVVEGPDLKGRRGGFLKRQASSALKERLRRALRLRSDFVRKFSFCWALSEDRMVLVLFCSTIVSRRVGTCNVPI